MVEKLSCTACISCGPFLRDFGKIINFLRMLGPCRNLIHPFLLPSSPCILQNGVILLHNFSGRSQQRFLSFHFIDIQLQLISNIIHIFKSYPTYFSNSLNLIHLLLLINNIIKRHFFFCISYILSMFCL